MPDSSAPITFRRADISFVSGGDVLRGWLYLPGATANDASAPACIVLSHGFSAVKEQYLDKFCEAFASAGFAALVFDHPCFGASDGLPRGEVSPARQHAAIGDAISVAQECGLVDPDRIGLWGSSYAGGHALHVAATDRRIKAVVAQVPTISGSRAAARRTKPDALAEFKRRVKDDQLARRAGGAPQMVPVTNDGANGLCALPGESSHAFFHNSVARAPNWRNEVTLQSIEMARAYEPGESIALIGPTPLLMIISDDDHLTPGDLAREAFDQCEGPKALEIIVGGHFAPYLEQFDECSQWALDWFNLHL